MKTVPFDIKEREVGVEVTDASVIKDTKHWIEKAVIGLGLCPFAKAVYVQEQIRYAVSVARTPEALLLDLKTEIQRLITTSPEIIDTTLVIHPHVLADFLDFNDFLGIADALISASRWDGKIQIASFHPQYQFEGTTPDAIENFTNRSPYPILQILRESSVEKGLSSFSDPDEIFQKNIETLRHLGHVGWKRVIAVDET
jgi:uncharacterized protein